MVRGKQNPHNDNVHMTSCHPFRWSMCRSLGCPKISKQIPDKPLEENGREASRWCSRPTNVSFPVFLFKHVTLCLTLLPWSCNHDPSKEFLLNPIPNILKDVYMYIYIHIIARGLISPLSSLNENYSSTGWWQGIFSRPTCISRAKSLRRSSKSRPDAEPHHRCQYGRVFL